MKWKGGGDGGGVGGWEGGGFADIVPSPSSSSTSPQARPHLLQVGAELPLPHLEEQRGSGSGLLSAGAGYLAGDLVNDELGSQSADDGREVVLLCTRDRFDGLGAVGNEDFRRDNEQQA